MMIVLHIIHTLFCNMITNCSFIHQPNSVFSKNHLCEVMHHPIHSHDYFVHALQSFWFVVGLPLKIKTMKFSFCQVSTCVYQIEGPMQFLVWPPCCMGVWKIVILMYSTMLSSASKCCTTCNNIQIYIFI